MAEAVEGSVEELPMETACSADVLDVWRSRCLPHENEKLLNRPDPK